MTSRCPGSIFICLWLLAAAGCTTCGEAYVAEVQSVEGTVERDHAERRGVFVAALVGDRFALGDGLRTGPRGHARLALSPEGLALVEPNTLLRFLAEQPGKPSERIALEEGAVAIERAPLDLEVHTPRAIARLSQHGKMFVSTSASGEERFDVLVGRVAISHDGEARELSGGESFALPAKPQPAARPPVAATPVAPAPLEVASAAPAPRLTGPSDLSLPPENAVLHVPAPPARVRIDLPPCEQPARVEIGAGRRMTTLRGAAGADHVMAALDVGAQRVRVRCGETLASDVLLRIQRDPATQELPKSAQRVDVEADGRKYTVHYQNVLPAVTFLWPSAPQAGPYTLVLQRGGKTQRYATPAPKLELRPGELAEGELRYWFEGSGARTRETTLRIVFDNTARSAYLSEPRMGVPVIGTSVVVAGAALAKSEVSVAGHSLPLDAQGRFRGEVPVAADEQSITVRVRHPQAGTHYYLRRIR